MNRTAYRLTWFVTIVLGLLIGLGVAGGLIYICEKVFP